MSLSEYCVAGAVRALNGGSRVLGDYRHRVPDLSGESLLAAARRRAELENFGTWPIEAPLQRLLDSYHREAHLTLLGRITVREMIVSLLENLLHMEAERAASPGLADASIEAPVFIVGLPRTGTTLLHNVITEDPENRVPLTWEVMYPAGHGGDPRAIERARRRTAKRLGWANLLAPEFKRIHPMAPDFPQECIAITAGVFMSIQFHTTHNVASYQDWFEQDSQRLAMDFHKRVLQHLQHNRRGERWVLKAPGHLFGLGALLERYPDARVIHTHRDPLRVMASMASHATVLRRAFSDRADPVAIARDWADRWANALDGFLAVRDRVPTGHFLDIGYESIERQPVETVERIYDFLGWQLSAQARGRMEAFLAANPKNKHGVHRYSLEQYGLNPAAEAERFASYCERFDIPVKA